MLLKDTIANALKAALERAQREGAISLAAVPDIEVERPNNPEHGTSPPTCPCVWPAPPAPIRCGWPSKLRNAWTPARKSPP